MPTPEPLRPSHHPNQAHPQVDHLHRPAARLPDKPAILDGDRSFSYRDLAAHSARFAAALAALGVRIGDRVAILAPNCAEFEIAFYGILRAGAVATTLNSGYREREIAHQLSSSGASVLVVHHTLLPAARAVLPSLPALRHIIPIDDGPPSPGSFWDLIEHAPAVAPAPSLSLDPRRNLAALPYSSGTTGLNKGVMLTHYNLACNVRQFIERPGDPGAPTEREVFLVHLPLFHIYALNVMMNVSIALGATQVLMGRFDPDLLLDLLSRHRVTSLYTAPPVILALSQHPRLGHYDFSALRMIVSGAAPLSADLQQRVSAALGVPIVQGYGLTETSPVTHIDFIDAARARPGTVGPPLPDTEQRVVDLDTGTRDLPSGEAGELLMRGPHVTPGYFNDPAATAATIDSDGWLHTGDIVSADAQGYLRILDRKKELIKYKGFQVPPAELEGLLLEHPAVADCAVIGIPDPEAGELPKAYVVLRHGVPATPATAEALIAHIAQRVATFKRIRAVEFLDAIPKNPSGKILRRLLRPPPPP